MKRWTLCTLGAIALASGTSSSRADVEVIYSRASAGATALVPSAVDLNGDPLASRFNSMLEFFLSPDGSRWLLRGSTDAGSDLANYLILGSGTSAIMNLQEGRPFPGAIDAEILEFHSSTSNRPFNQNNEWAFPIRSRGGATANAQKVLKFTSAGIGSLALQQGDLYTGILDTGAAGDETVGNSAGSICLTNSGDFYLHDNTVGNLSSTLRPVIVQNDAKFLQVQVDDVTGINGVDLFKMSNYGSAGTFSVLNVSPDGTRVVVRGNVDTNFDGRNFSPTDPVCVLVDNVVRVQEGELTPGGSGITPTAINQAAVAPNNDWFVRGTDAAGAFALRNAQVLAKTGDAIGGGDTWGASMTTLAGNANGDWVIVGKSNNANTAFDDVVVVNGEVVLREGDAVQLDLDGLPPLDTAYIGRGNLTSGAFAGSGTNLVGIAPDRTVYVISSLRSDANGGSDISPTGVSYALIRITPNSGACPGDYNGSGAVDLLDLLAFNADWSGNLGTSVPMGTLGDYDANGSVDLLDLLAFNADWSANLGQPCP